jgi:hypothetical protein
MEAHVAELMPEQDVVWHDEPHRERQLEPALIAPELEPVPRFCGPGGVGSLGALTSGRSPPTSESAA